MKMMISEIKTQLSAMYIASAMLSLMACQTSAAVPIFAPDGKAAYQISCLETPETTGRDMCRAGVCSPLVHHHNTLEECETLADQYCPNGWEIVGETVIQRAIHIRHIQLVRCR